MGVGRRYARRAHVVAMLDETEDVLDVADVLFSEADNLDLLFGVLKYSKFLLVVEEVKYLHRGSRYEETNKKSINDRGAGKTITAII